MSKNTDNYYINRVKTGDAGAFRYLVDKYKPMAFTLTIQLVRHHQVAEELCQDAFLKAFHGLKGYKGEAAFSTWLYRIVYNTAVSYMRKKKRYTLPLEEEVVEVDDGALNPMEQLSRDEALRILDQALLLMDEEDRFLLTLYYLEEKSVKEMGSITEQSESNVKIRLFRGRKKLHKILSDLLKQEVDSLRLHGQK
ncbi:MAG: sigma-70 family RNA polymerase sigma factor [Bacteroidales bacterium]